MITPRQLSENLARTYTTPIPPAPNLINQTPTNRILKTGKKMDNDNVKADSVLQHDDRMSGTHAMTTRASARLLDKLQKLKDTPTTTGSVPMDCDAEDIKKRTRPVKIGDTQVPTAAKPNLTPTPEAKRSRNGATPPPAKTTQAMLPSQLSHEEELIELEDEKMESISEEVEVPADSEEKAAIVPEADPQQPSHDGEGQQNQGDEQDQEAPLEDGKAEANQDQEEDQEPEDNNSNDDLSESEVVPVKEVDPKEWRKLHDEWLHAAMRAAMGDPTLVSIPDIENIERMERKPFVTNLRLQPERPFCRRYDLRLSVTGGDDQITLFHQALVKWYQKVREVDATAILHPWSANDRSEDPSPLIENPTDVPTALPTLRKFVHKLFLRTSGGDYHVQILMGSQEDFPTIMQTIGWWLKSTSQGMWITELQTAEDTICAGWLLFSAGDYDREALAQEIWNFTGVQVALRFRAIDDGKRVDKSKKTDQKPTTPTTVIKALHVDVDKVHQGVNRSRIEHLYSSTATVFPLGIKMRFVRDLRLLTNSQAKAKAECLRAHQERFLTQMETCTTWEIACLDLEERVTEATLRQLIMNIPDPANPKSRLFHSVNKMFIKSEYILRFHPSRSQNARDVVAGLCVYLKGLWQGVIDVSKFNKFFTDTAIDRSKDAWWDPSQKCVMTKADEEMASILSTDKDLIFPDKKVVVEIPKATSASAGISQGGDELLSTGSISTFRTSGTTQTRNTRKTKGKVKIPSTTNTVTSSTDTTISGSTLTEKDINLLLGRLMQALQLQNNGSHSSSAPPGGDTTRQGK